jgi:hypothetical protein
MQNMSARNRYSSLGFYQVTALLCGIAVHRRRDGQVVKLVASLPIAHRQTDSSGQVGAVQHQVVCGKQELKKKEKLDSIAFVDGSEENRHSFFLLKLVKTSKAVRNGPVKSLLRTLNTFSVILS